MKKQFESLNSDKFKTLSPNMMAIVTGGRSTGGDGADYTATANGKTFHFYSDCYELDDKGQWYAEWYTKDGTLIASWHQ